MQKTVKISFERKTSWNINDFENNDSRGSSAPCNPGAIYMFMTIIVKQVYYVPPPKELGDILFLVWIPAASRRSFLSAPYLLNHWMDLDQTGTETSLGQLNGVNRFR